MAGAPPRRARFWPERNNTACRPPKQILMPNLPILPEPNRARAEERDFRSTVASRVKHRFPCAGEWLTREEMAVVATEIDPLYQADAAGRTTTIPERAAGAGVSARSYSRHRSRPHVARALERLRQARSVVHAAQVLDLLLEIARRTSGLEEVSGPERRLFYSTLAQILGSAVGEAQDYERTLSLYRLRTPRPKNEPQMVMRALLPLFALRAIDAPHVTEARCQPAARLSDEMLHVQMCKLGLELPKSVGDRLVGPDPRRKFVVPNHLVRPRW